MSNSTINRSKSNHETSPSYHRTDPYDRPPSPTSSVLSLSEKRVKKSKDESLFSFFFGSHRSSSLDSNSPDTRNSDFPKPSDIQNDHSNPSTPGSSIYSSPLEGSSKRSKFRNSSITLSSLSHFSDSPSSSKRSKIKKKFFPFVGKKSKEAAEHTEAVGKRDESSHKSFHQGDPSSEYSTQKSWSRDFLRTPQHDLTSFDGIRGGFERKYLPNTGFVNSVM
ncbi:hypothetical protein K7432_013705 [Basidiobolus ranarum]|uniref:Uncharacterized protein n=1 Tax=Basidiobolus ranarum TaxID=34480 RepID=A0ABR2VQI3_9FUNG